MISQQDIKDLAELARIEVKEEDLESVRAKMDGVLQYVSEVQQITATDTDILFVPALHNVLREDVEAEMSGIHTEGILKNTPEKDGGYVKVRKIL